MEWADAGNLWVEVKQMNPNKQPDPKTNPSQNLPSHQPPVKQSSDPSLPFGPETIASSMECTGLIPSLPMTEAEADSYKELYDVPCQQQDDMEAPCQWEKDKRSDPKKPQ